MYFVQYMYNTYNTLLLRLAKFSTHCSFQTKNKISHQNTMAKLSRRTLGQAAVRVRSTDPKSSLSGFRFICMYLSAFRAYNLCTIHRIHRLKWIYVGMKAYVYTERRKKIVQNSRGQCSSHKLSELMHESPARLL